MLFIFSSYALGRHLNFTQIKIILNVGFYLLYHVGKYNLIEIYCDCGARRRVFFLLCSVWLNSNKTTLLPLPVTYFFNLKIKTKHSNSNAPIPMLQSISAALALPCRLPTTERNIFLSADSHCARSAVELN